MSGYFFGLLSVGGVMKINKIAIMWPRFGPYHISRLEETGRFLVGKEIKLIAIETARTDNIYQWDIINGASYFTRIQLFRDAEYANVSAKAIIRKVIASLDQLQPDVIAINGYAIPESRAAIYWSIKNKKALVLICDSNYFDTKRIWYREVIKSGMVSYCNAAFVAGKCSKDYVIRLGMSEKEIFTGYDAVDNEYFSSQADAVRQDANTYRRKYALPEKYFLSSNRFIPKKNLFRLLDAYDNYRQQVKEPWGLVLLGDGELRPEIEKKIEELKLANSVVLPGFKQYKDLPPYYALAKCYTQASTAEQWGLVVNEAMASGLPVLVSKMCGCQEDLVEDGGNGFTFDPFSVEDICEKMVRISSDNCDLEKMGQRSKEIISNWGCDNFAKNLFVAAEYAMRNYRKKSIISRLLLKALMWK